MRFIVKIAQAFTLLLLAASAAAAHTGSRILNLSQETQRFEVRLLNAQESITLAPGRRWETYAYPVRVRKGDAEFALERDADYAIWPDGTLAIQRRGNRIGGRW